MILKLIKQLKIYKNLVFLLGFLLVTAHSLSQNKDYLEFKDEDLTRQEKCLSIESDYSDFKLVPLKPNQVLDNLKIRVESLDEQLEFNTVDSFNAYDFRFWLVSNRIFNNSRELEINITYRFDDLNIEQIFKICLVEPDTSNAFKVGRGSSPSPDYVKLPIYFGTDRKYHAAKVANESFGTKRSKLSYGIVQVSIPHDHRVGEIETPSIWRFEFSEDPTKHVMLHEIDILDKKEFFSNLSKSISESDKKSTFLFVHGYNTSFAEAARRTAQISYDLKFDGKAVFYSWPSQASTFHYRTDEKNIAWSRKNLKLFLEDYLTITDAEEIYLIAHSMGNRGLTKAIIEVMKNKPELSSKIKEIILAAPDIDAEVFKNKIAPQMVSLTQKPITLYVSADDMALKASKLINGKPRAGDVIELPVIVEGIETIDASGLDTSFMKHSYFADTNSIVADIFELIQSGNRALERKMLKLIKVQNQIYYDVKP